MWTLASNLIKFYQGQFIDSQGFDYGDSRTADSHIKGVLSDKVEHRIGQLKQFGEWTWEV